MASLELDLRDAHTEMPSLEGRKAVITGGTTGIGRAIGVLLASEGVEIFTCGRDERHLADGLARINEVGKGSGISVDLAEKAGLIGVPVGTGLVLDLSEGQLAVGTVSRSEDTMIALEFETPRGASIRLASARRNRM